MRQASPAYSRVFTSLFVGVSLLVTGAIGFDVRGLHGALAGGRWTDAPIWWQIALGSLAVIAAGYWARRIVIDSSPGATASR